MDELQGYCPVMQEKTVVQTTGESEPDTIEHFHYHSILFGGDQLTVARIRGAQRIRLNSEDERGRLEGLVPCVEDWHTKVTLLEVYILHTTLHRNLMHCVSTCMYYIYNYLGDVGEAVQKGDKYGRWNYPSAEKSVESFKCST